MLSVLGAAIGTLALGAGSARAEDIAFLEASSELDDGKAATSAYNAVDGKDTTVWCSKKTSGESAQRLSFGFDQVVTVTHLALVVAPPKADSIDKTNKRAKTVSIGTQERRVEAKFKDDPAVQTVELAEPLKGKRFVLEVLGMYDGQAPDAPVCIAEVTLKHKDTAMTGAQIATKMRALGSSSKRLLHEWLDDVAAPQRTLVFNLDGTFTYQYEPLMEGKPVKLRGKWTAADKSITFDTLGKTFKMKLRVTKIDEGGAGSTEMTLEGDGPTPSLASTFKPAPDRFQ